MLRPYFFFTRTVVLASSKVHFLFEAIMQDAWIQVGLPARLFIGRQIKKDATGLIASHLLTERVRLLKMPVRWGGPVLR